MEAAKKAAITYSETSIQKAVDLISQEAGTGNHIPLVFGRYGLHRIGHPLREGAWLNLERGSIKPGQGAKFSTFNCSSSDQQSLLMALWCWWANTVLDCVKEKT